MVFSGIISLQIFEGHCQSHDPAFQISGPESDKERLLFLPSESEEREVTSSGRSREPAARFSWGGHSLNHHHKMI
jgi:hypothetical protein